jgi:hypothetical protein
MKRGGEGFHTTAAPATAFLLGLLITIIVYYPVLAPLFDGKLQFTYGDLNAPYGEDSASIRKEWTFYTFDQGTNKVETNRFYPLAALSALSDWIEFSESQLTSALIVLSMVLGGLGLYLIGRNFIQDWRYCSAAILALIPFYFLNLWSVERICHVWIWFTYAIVPLFLALGIMFLRDGRNSRLIAYSLLMAFFGFPPHSLIYILFFHAFVIAFAALSNKKWSDVAKLAFIPLVIYVLINLPPLSLGQNLQGEVVSGIGEDGIRLLSRNGELANLFAFSNNWWYQVSKTEIFSNPAFTYSSIGVFALIFLSFGLSFGRMGRDERIVSILALAGLLAIIFIAQGAKNSILAPALLAIAKSDFSVVLRPFREWARICILIPPIIAIILASCMNDRAFRLPIIACFSALVLANIAFSPSWSYMSNVHAATYGIDDFQYLKDHVGIDSKTIWPGIMDNRLPTTTASGKNTSTNTGIRRISGIGRLYYSEVVAGYEDRKRWKVMPRPLMDALNIRDVITTDYREALEWYGWMDCTDIGHMVLCHDGKASTPLRVYDGAIIADAVSMEPLFHIPSEDYALTSENVSFGKYFATGIGRNGSAASGSPIYSIEAESGLDGQKHKLVSPESSNRTSVFFPGNLSASMDFPEGGDYGIALLGNGSFAVAVGGNNLSLRIAEDGYVLSGPFHLENGASDIRIKRSNRSDSLDAILVYRYENGSSGGPFAIGTPPPARIEEYSNVDPTRWHMKISAQKPFLLAFAETYDTQWIAEVYRDGRQIGTIMPISLYDTMNGYWVNETGELEIRLRYKSQERYEQAMIVSLAAIAACAGGLALTAWKEGASDGKA